MSFARYLNAMHARIHPLFSDWLLESLDSLPASDPINEKHLITRFEIVLGKGGTLKQLGVIKSSGNTRFDVAVLDAMDRAQPFDTPPAEIVSPDGNVYMHWEFFRDPIYGCSPMGASPYLLR